MIYLIINTATKRNEIYLATKNKILNKKKWISNRDESDKLLPYISTLLENSKKDFKDISHILVITGPGGFTSLRVGITVANTIAYAQNIPIAGINLFEWWKKRLIKQNTDFFILHSATRKDMFVSGYGKHKNLFKNIELIEFEKFIKKVKSISPFLYIGDLIDEHKLKLKNLSSSLLKTNDEKLLPILKEIQWKDGKYVEPFYGRMGQVKG